VGVTPGSALRAHGELFNALESVFPVRFESRESGEYRELDAIVMLGPVEVPPSQPCLIAAEGHQDTVLTGAGDAAVRFGSHRGVDRSLRGAVLHDGRVGNLKSLRAERREEVIAEGPAGPVWTARFAGKHRLHTVAMSPAQPDSALPLRAQMREGQFLSLLPLVEFLREVTKRHEWSTPPLRATFVIDDPNLRRPTYGFIDFRALSSHAADHGYHAAVATVPLDSWPVSSAATRVFASNPSSISLAVHGNQHLRYELERFRSAANAREQMDQALRRVDALERRAGVRIDRVMAAPHERCSPVATAAMLHAGFEALTIDRANPWRFRPDEEKAVAGWELAELVSGGLPVLRREHVGVSRGDLVLRAFLHQPLILYGHHNDLAEGPDRLASVAKEIDRLGDVRWKSLGEIARTNYLLRKTGSLLTVRMLCRRARLRVPEGVSEISVETPNVRGAADGTVTIGNLAARWERDGRNLRSPETQVDSGTIDIALTPPERTSTVKRVRPTNTAWALGRRVIAEGRDRLQPLEHRMRRGEAR